MKQIIEQEALESADCVKVETEAYVMRVIRSKHGMPSADVINHVCDCLEKTFLEIFDELPGIDLFVTLTGAHVFANGPNESDQALGIYHSGLFHVALCGLPPDEDIEGFDFIAELRKTIIHELLHFSQEIHGVMMAEAGEELEIETDNETDKIHAKLFEAPIT